MKKIFIFLFFSIFLFSCWNENTITQTELSSHTIKNDSTKKTDDISNYTILPSADACGIISCELKKYLEDKEATNKLNLEKAQYFQKRFWTMLARYGKKDVLIKTQEYQKFVQDFHQEYFSWKSIYTYDEKNFIWYIFLPRMVSSEFMDKWLNTENGDIESVVQSIKEKYFGTYDEKQMVVQAYKDNLVLKAKNLDISGIDKEKLKTDKKYFEEIILTPWSWIYDKLVWWIVDIIWPEKWQMKEIVLFSEDVFFNKLKELWIEKKYFYEIVWTSEDNFKKANKKLLEIDKKYWLSKKVPSDRYLRHEEILNYVFNNVWDFNKKGDFNGDILEIKHYNLLQYSFPDEALYNMNSRVSKYNVPNNFLIENMFKYSKTLDEDSKL